MNFTNSLGQKALADKLFAPWFPHILNLANGIELHQSLRDESRIRGIIGVRDAVNPTSVHPRVLGGWK
jgi:hypothetical protein